MIKAIIFDLDGTLINTTEAIVSSLLAAFKFYNIEPLIKENEFASLMGLSLEETLNLLIPKNNYQRKKEIASFYVEYYYKHFMNTARSYDGVLQVLEDINNKGIKIALATAKRSSCADSELASAGLKNFFEVIQGTDENMPSKPDPFIIYGISKKINIPTDNMLMVGDTGRDILFGQNAGCKTVAVTYGNWNKERFIKEKIIPDFFINDIRELIALL